MSEELWCVQYLTIFNGKPHRCSRWWTTEEAAKQHAAERNKKGDTNVKISHYKLVGDDIRET